MGENRFLEYKETITNTFLKTVSAFANYEGGEMSTVEVDHTEMTRLILEGSNLNYEELPSGMQGLTFEKLEKELKSKTGIERLDLNILKTLNLFSDKNGYNIAAEILADENTLPGIDIGKFGDTISIIKKRKIYEHTSALNLYDAAYEMFRDYYEYDIIEGPERTTVSLIPGAAYREAVANALIHRVWDVKDPVRIFMFDDRVEIFSPGGLLRGMTKEAYLSGNYSSLRNPVISNVFFRLRIVEIFGTGIRRIKEAYQDSISKPEFEVYENAIKVILPVVKERTSLKGDAGLVYDAVSGAEGSSISQIAEKVPFGKTKVHKILMELESKDLIRITGNGRGTKYHKV